MHVCMFSCIYAYSHVSMSVRMWLFCVYNLENAWSHFYVRKRNKRLYETEGNSWRPLTPSYPLPPPPPHHLVDLGTHGIW